MAGQLMSSPLRAAQNRLQPQRGNSQCSTTTIVPIGIRIRPYTTTKSNIFVKMNGEQAKIVVITPAISVTRHRGQPGETT